MSRMLARYVSVPVGTTVKCKAGCSMWRRHRKRTHRAGDVRRCRELHTRNLKGTERMQRPLPSFFDGERGRCANFLRELEKTEHCDVSRSNIAGNAG